METKIRMITIASSLILLLLSYSACLVALSEHPMGNTSSVVVDVDGNQVEANTKYYLSSLNHHGGGGLALSIRDRRLPCPPNVLQEKDQSSMGLSLKMFPVDNKQLHISMHTDVNIVFMGATICVQSTVWRLGNRDPFTRRRYVRSGGVMGRPGAETVGNWFKLERFGEEEEVGYKIVYCPSVCSSCKVECGEIGVYAEEEGINSSNRRWLAFGGQPLVIAFTKL